MKVESVTLQQPLLSKAATQDLEKGNLSADTIDEACALWNEQLMDGMGDFGLLSYMQDHSDRCTKLVRSIYETPQAQSEAMVDIGALRSAVLLELQRTDERALIGLAEALRAIDLGDFCTDVGAGKVELAINGFVTAWGAELTVLQGRAGLFAELSAIAVQCMFAGHRDPVALFRKLARNPEEREKAENGVSNRGESVKALVELLKEEVRESDEENKEELPDDAYNLALLWAMNRPINTPAEDGLPLRRFPGVLAACLVSALLMLVATIAMDATMFGLQEDTFAPIGGMRDWKDYVPLAYVPRRMAELAADIREGRLVQNVFSLLALGLFLGKVQEECLSRAKTFWVNRTLAAADRSLLVDVFVFWGTFFNPVWLGLCGVAMIIKADSTKDVVLNSVAVTFVAEVDNILLKLYLNTCLYVVPGESWMVPVTEEVQVDNAGARGEFQTFEVGLAVFSLVQALCTAPFVIALCQYMQWIPIELSNMGPLFFSVSTAMWTMLYSWQKFALVRRKGHEGKQRAVRSLVHLAVSTVVGLGALWAVCYFW